MLKPSAPFAFPTGMQIGDGTARHHDQNGQDLGLMCLLGTFAEYTVVHEAYLAAKPDSLSMVEAASVPLVWLTAWESLFDRYALQAGDSVLIHGGAGGVGYIAIQIAKAAGATKLSRILDSLARGAVLGGSSSINGHIYSRGRRADYDTWAQLGNRGWSYSEVLPYFKRAERRVGDGWHDAVYAVDFAFVECPGAAD